MNATPLTSSAIAGMIDHALLSPTLDDAAFEKGIATAVKYRTASVCIMPWYLRRCADALAGTGVKACTVIGFPHGGHTTAAKVREAELALADGGEELDMVINISAARSGKWDLVGEEIREIVGTAHAAGAKAKVIFETCYLDRGQKIRVCELCAAGNADWVKTSTGFGTAGALDDDLRLMREHSPASMQLKASGGIRTFARAKEIIDLGIGVTRLGCSATEAIVSEAIAALGR